MTDEERLYELVPMLMINFKYAIVTEELKHMLYALQDPALAHDNEKCNSLMQRYNEMREVQSLMAKRLATALYYAKFLIGAETPLHRCRRQSSLTGNYIVHIL